MLDATGCRMLHVECWMEGTQPPCITRIDIRALYKRYLGAIRALYERYTSAIWPLYGRKTNLLYGRYNERHTDAIRALYGRYTSAVQALYGRHANAIRALYERYMDAIRAARHGQARPGRFSSWSYTTDCSTFPCAKVMCETTNMTCQLSSCNT